MLALPVAAAPIYSLTPLVTDDQDALADEGFAPAVTVDPNLINPWGVSLAPTSPFSGFKSRDKHLDALHG